MSSADIEMRPAKKRRFFVEDDKSPSQSPPAVNAFVGTNTDNGALPDVDMPESSRDVTTEGMERESNGLGNQIESGGFDSALFSTLVGEDVPPETIEKIRHASKDNLERAVNLYFDGNWKSVVRTPTPATSSAADPGGQPVRPVESTTSELDQSTWAPPEGAGEVLRSNPPERYVGAFGVGAWATKSGKGMIGHGEAVRIDRTKQQPPLKLGRGGKVVTRPNQRGDVITRFTNQRGEEIGRLPRETAAWVSTLIDQKICSFQGVCVFAPDRIRVNDTIYIQLRCYLLNEAFIPKRLRGLSDDNRSAGLFEEKESEEEKDLRLRQIALIKLFDEINLMPASANETTVKHKKEGLLQAAEVAEQYDKNKEKSKDPNASSDEEDSEELQQDQLDSLYKKAQSFDFSTPEAEPGENFIMDLRKYQKQALYWMLKKEKNTKSEKEVSMHPLWEDYTWPVKDVDDNALPCVRRQDHFYVNPYSGELSLEFPVQKQNCLGGILADEMGLGKTIEMLSLVHSHKAEINTTGSQGDSGMSVNSLTRQPKTSFRALPAPHTTLVVAPTSLLAQWENEAIKASKPGTMKAFVYYGTDKSIDLRNLCCSESSNSAPDLIITSYGVVLSEYRQLGPNGLTGAALGGLFSVEFFRVILDEAHHIKNRRSKTARACYDISAIHRWVLTGTPIVNRLEDLFSLVRFLKVEPWSNFSFWKTFITMPFESKDFVRALNVVQTVLEPLVLRRTKTMKTPDGEALVPLPPRTITIEEVELSEKEREIYDYIFTRAKQSFNDNVEAGTLLKSYSTIFTQILRLRQTCCHPVLTRNKDIVAEEEDAAVAADETNGMKDDMDLQELIAKFTASTEEAPDDQQDSGMAKFTAHALKQIQTESSGECPICAEEPMIQPAVTGCWHSACKQCLQNFITHQTDRGKTPRCFSCRETLTPRDIFEVIRHSPSFQQSSNGNNGGDDPPSTQTPRISIRRINPLSPSAHTSAKIHALLTHLSRIPSNSRSVVFSQFTSFFDLISPQLTRAGIPHLRLDGTMAQKARAEVIAKFTAPDPSTDIEDEEEETKARGHQPKIAKPPPSPQPNVLLISLRAGGVGLNLTAANNVFMMDPWWSFAVEAQAIDRVHRMGQMRDVSVTRFVVKNSIEGRMLQVQDRKMRIAGSLGLRVGGDGGEEERKKERVEELKLLFE
ncbi:DNA helicase rad5 [Arachnomyces sp. PD_36]|nr:DNA helicase rad5 [Arachnomyces sp. PD_36]